MDEIRIAVGNNQVQKVKIARPKTNPLIKLGREVFYILFWLGLGFIIGGLMW